MRHTPLHHALLSAFILIPGVPLSDWHIERYAHIPENTVSISASGMKVSVRESAGPIVYAFHEVRQINGFRIRGSFSALPKISGADSGNEGIVDDFPLRVGFVVAGDKHLGFFQRLTAPDWVKHLYASAPAGIGLDRVQFYTLSLRPELVGRSRIHPDSDLVHETFFAAVSTPGPFHYDYRLPKALNAVAVWIAMDGDDTHSDYDVTLTDLEIE